MLSFPVASLPPSASEATGAAAPQNPTTYQRNAKRAAAIRRSHHHHKYSGYPAAFATGQPPDNAGQPCPVLIICSFMIKNAPKPWLSFVARGRSK
jgi:hypothetical protein